jgi:hypothetical protein
VNCIHTNPTILRILELVLRMNTTGPILRIPVVVVRNMNTFGAILVRSSMERSLTLQRTPLVVVIGVNSYHLH